MKRVSFLVLFILFASCGTSRADVITTWDESIFEGSFVNETEDGKVFSVDSGTVFIYFQDLLGIENRTPTADERAKLISFKTGRYDVTNESETFTPFEDDVIGELYVSSEGNPDISDHSLARLVGQKYNLPPIIVELLMEKDFWMWF